MNLFLVLITAFLFLQNPAQAGGGGHEGHGGDGVICENNPSNVELSDFFEAEQQTSDYQIDLLGTDYLAITQQAIQRVAAIDPTYSARLEAALTRFLDHDKIQFVDRAKLKPVDDAQEQIEPLPGCSIVQLALQNAKPLPFEARLWIDQNLWSKLSPVHQAGLIFHELIIAVERDYHLKDTRNLRHFVATVFSSKFKTLEVNDYGKLGELLKSQLLGTNYQGFRLIYNRHFFYDANQKIAEAMIQTSAPVEVKSPYSENVFCRDDMPVAINQKGLIVSCFLGGTLPSTAFLSISTHQNARKKVMVQSYYYKWLEKGEATDFYENGVPKQVLVWLMGGSSSDTRLQLSVDATVISNSPTTPSYLFHGCKRFGFRQDCRL